MRALIGMSLALLGCTSAKEKDCKEIAPVVSAAHADPSDENIEKLKSFRASDADVGAAVTGYRKQVERLNAGRTATQDLVAAMKMKPGAKPFDLSMFDASRPHAETLFKRCMPQNAPPECAELSRALEACITPARDDTTAEEQLLTCANGFAAVKSPNLTATEAIQALASTIRDLEPFARDIGAPAKQVIAAAKKNLPKIDDAQKARPDVNKMEMAFNATCGRR